MIEVFSNELSARGSMPILAHQVAVSGDFADRVTAGHDPRCPQLIDDPPEVEVLKRAVGKILTFRNPRHSCAAFNDRA